MNKIVPDPPPCPTTAHTDFGICKGAHPPLFSVRADTDFEDALAHLSAALTAAFQTNDQLCEILAPPMGDIAWSTYQSLEICQALCQAMLKGMEQQRLSA